MNARHAAVAALLGVALLPAARAQADPGTGAPAKDLTVADLLEASTVPMPITTPPATFLLGAAGTAVPRVASFRELGVQLSNAVGDNGKIKNAVAVEINPRLAMAPVQWSDYQISTLTQILTRTTVSIATATNEGDKGARSAIGIQSVLYNGQMSKLITTASTDVDCVGIARDFVAKSTGTIPGSLTPGSLITPDSPKFEETKARCKKKIEGLLSKWNPNALAVGLGQALQSNDATIGRLKRSSAGLWVTASLGQDWSLAEEAKDNAGFGLTLHARRMVHERVADPANEELMVDEASKLLGANLRIASGRFAALAEYSARKSKATQLVDENRKRSFFGIEYRVADELYIVAGAGSDTGRRDGKDQRVSLLNLKWGFSKKAMFDPR